MCRNITELRGLQPPATDEEIEAAARQFVRKVSGLRQPPPAVDRPAAAPARGPRPARTLTARPLRRPEVRARLGRRPPGRCAGPRSAPGSDADRPAAAPAPGPRPRRTPPARTPR